MLKLSIICFKHTYYLGMRTVGHKSHDPCFHKKYMEAGVMIFVTRCTYTRLDSEYT